MTSPTPLEESVLLARIQQSLDQRDFQNVLQQTLWLVERFPSHSNVLVASQKLRGIAPWLKDQYPKHHKVRIALCFSSTAQWVVDYLVVRSFQENLYPEIYVTPYNHLEQQILVSGSDFYQFQPEIVFLHLELESILPLIHEYQSQDVQNVLAHLLRLIDPILSRTKAIVVVDNFISPTYFLRSPDRNLKITSLKDWFYHLNHDLELEWADNPSVVINDLDSLSAVHGKERVRSLKWYYLAHMEFSESFLPLLSARYIGFIKALKGKLRKCIVLDLDDTLWGGTIGEDGMDGIRLSQTGQGEPYYEFQRVLRDLNRRGILLAINSKNNYEDAIQVLQKHPAMLLREENFAALKINWQDKATNLIEIAKELNIGLDSMVFLENDPRERDLIRHSFPQVLVPELPIDSSEYGLFISKMNDFEQLAVSEEDLKRAQLYKEQRARTQFQKTVQSFEEFLWSLEIQARIDLVTENDLPRVVQLMQRTNQFNMANRRYLLLELKQMLSSQDHLLFVLRVKDRFGDSGSVGTIVVEKQNQNKVFFIKEFLLSCRVLGRGIENFFMNYLLEIATQHETDRLIGEVFYTEKNQPARSFYQTYGFCLLEQTDSGSRWVYSVKERPPKPVPWIRVNSQKNEQPEHSRASIEGFSKSF